MSFRIRRRRTRSSWGHIPLRLTLAEIMADLVGPAR
jgi:hypothetical protein